MHPSPPLLLHQPQHIHRPENGLIYKGKQSLCDLCLLHEMKRSRLPLSSGLVSLCPRLITCGENTDEVSPDVLGFRCGSQKDLLSLHGFLEWMERRNKCSGKQAEVDKSLRFCSLQLHFPRRLVLSSHPSRRPHRQLAVRDKCEEKKK